MNSANQDHKDSVALVSCDITVTRIDQGNLGAGRWIADDLQWSIRGPYSRVRFRRGNSEFQAVDVSPELVGYRAVSFSVQGERAEALENDVNRLNRYLYDIERFLIRIRSADLARQELDLQAHRYQAANRRYMRDESGFLHYLHENTQFPSQPEFVDSLRKFKLSFNLLAKLSLIHKPVSQLVHYLFIALNIILEACHWELGKKIAPQIVWPLLSLEACELMQNSLTSKESGLWMSLGEAWRTPPEEWRELLLAPFMERTAL
ncbi:unnamed protein product [Cylicocyclus nassatus]|uniref:EPS8 spectrin-like domain-containing protein n=1 Tax=Cylicocyclus nassatus TaxID=53992 RepID=A0AA36DP61_CYLNA|nr:unnamed protein product [Cylicocyclus nassatus]